MKSYHLTQEHVLGLVKRLDKEGANLAALPEGGIEVLGIKGLQQLVNAAIDQVLGEPVAYQVPLRYGSKVTLNKPVKPVDWDDDFIKWDYKPLYAPKEQL